ncbi:MAG: hypothetical protein A2145_04540 [candidate division Zixibacteria bacterium RBG_16_40_9]|nr:MAG: hypothetical protein A2145_04540 [candidate division Zixibacteria bacterium RBG_16_40_9]
MFLLFVFFPCLSVLSQTFQKVKFTPEPAAEVPKDIQPMAPSAEGKAIIKDVLGNYVTIKRKEIPYQPPLKSDVLVGGPDIYLQDGSETALAINYDNMNNLVAGYNEHWDFNPDITHSNSTNGNISWTSRSFPVGGGTYTDYPFDPWANPGNASSEFYSTQIRNDAASANSHSVVSRSIDGGASFSLFFERVKAVFQDREMADIDRTSARGGGAGSTHDGKVYLCYDDWGAGFSGYVGSFLQAVSSAGAPLTEIQISGTGAPPFRGSQMQPVPGITDGTVYVMASAIGGVPSGRTIFAYFHEITGAGAGAIYTKSTLSWEAAGQQLGVTSRWGLNGHRIDNHGYLDIDLSSGPRRGHLYFIYNRNPNSFDATMDQGDIRLSVSTTGASSWATTTIPTAAGKTQYFPMLDVDDQGWLHVSYYQNESGLVNGGVLNASSANLYYTLSTNGGLSWLTPVQINAPANTLDMPDPPPDRSAAAYYLVGDYAQVQARGTASSTKVYTLWTGFDKDRSGALGDTDERVLCTIVCAGKSGDANGDGSVGIPDIIYLANYVFKGGPEPFPICAGDCNGSGGNPAIADIIYLSNHVFKGGPVPVKIGLCCI